MHIVCQMGAQREGAAASGGMISEDLSRTPAQPNPHAGAFWNNAEREFSEFALYYHLPSVSKTNDAPQNLKSPSPVISLTLNPKT